MISIFQLKQKIIELLNEEEYVKIKMEIGNLNKHLFNKSLNYKSVNIFKKFLFNKKYKYKYINQTKYYYNDLILINEKNKQKCIKILPTSFFNMKINNTKKNNHTSDIQCSIINFINQDSINFPFIKKYHNIENNKTIQFIIKYKNSEIKLNITNNKYINIITSIEKINLDNFIINIKYILSKFYFTKF